MTGPYGDLSSPALLRAGTRPSSGSSAVPGNSGASSENKRKTAVFDPLSERWMCSQCPKLFRSRHGVYGHMHFHTRLAKQQAEGGASPSAVAAQRKKIHEDLDLNKKAAGVHEEQDEELARTLLKLRQWTLNKMEGREMKDDGSAVAEGGASLSVAEAQGKKIRMKLDLNKDAPEDDERETKVAEGGASLSGAEARGKKIRMKLDLNKDAPEDDEWETKVAEGGASLSGAEARRKKIHMKLDLNKDAPEDDERETKGDGSAVAEGGASLSEAEARRKKIHMKLDLNNDAPEDDENDDEEGA